MTKRYLDLWTAEKIGSAGKSGEAVLVREDLEAYQLEA